MSHFSAADVHLGHLGILTYSNASYSVRAQKGSIFCPRAHQQRPVGVLPLSYTISPRWRFTGLCRKHIFIRLHLRFVLRNKILFSYMQPRDFPRAAIHITDLWLLQALYFCPQHQLSESSGVTSTHPPAHSKALTVSSAALRQFRHHSCPPRRRLRPAPLWRWGPFVKPHNTLHCGKGTIFFTGVSVCYLWIWNKTCSKSLFFVVFFCGESSAPLSSASLCNGAVEQWSRMKTCHTRATVGRVTSAPGCR